MVGGDQEVGGTLRTELVRLRTEAISYVRRCCMVECGGGTLRTEVVWCRTEVIRYVRRWYGAVRR